MIDGQILGFIFVCLVIYAYVWYSCQRRRSDEHV